MIDNIVSVGDYLTAYTSSGTVPYINQYSGNPMVGAVAFDSGSQKLKVYDGSSWQTWYGSSATVQLTPVAVSTLKWAEKKMFEEEELERLALTHPTIKDLVDDINNKKDQIKMVQTLLKSPGHDSITGN